MSVKKAVTCHFCGFTTTYTNAAEHILWQGRSGCPACYKPEGEDEQTAEPKQQQDAPESFDALAKWYMGELQALDKLVALGVLDADERTSIIAELRVAVRTMAGVDS